MSLTHLLTHTVDIYRCSQDAGPLRTVERTWGPLSVDRTGVGADVQTRGERQADDGGGERTAGTHLCFMDVGEDVQEGDILHVRTGPGASEFPFLWVEGYSTPRGHHIELQLTATKEDPT